MHEASRKSKKRKKIEEKETLLKAKAPFGER